jgi:hypothetical protein
MEKQMAKSKVVAKAVKTPKTPKVKTVRLNHTQKLVTVMISGKVVTKDEIESLLGDQIQMYKLSTYMWAIKTKMNGTIKVVKDGRKVAGYQLLNPNDLIAVSKVKEYMKQTGSNAAGKVTKLKDLGATESAATETVAEEMTVTEVTA